MKKKLAIFIIIVVTNSVYSQDILHDAYFRELKEIGAVFFGHFYQYPNFIDIYKLDPEDFAAKIEEYKLPFSNLTNSYYGKLDSQFIHLQEVNNDLFFDKFLIEYNYKHKLYTKETRELPTSIQIRLRGHNIKLNNPDYLELEGYKEYIETFLQLKSDELLRNRVFKSSNNKQLESKLSLLPEYFSNEKCLNYWQHYFLKKHIEDCGVKNIKDHIEEFVLNCNDSVLKSEILQLYEKELKERTDHKILTYKRVGGFELDMHLFLPDSSLYSEVNKTAFIYFHGGGWTEGKPDWFFETCRNHAKNGVVAAAVEYRIFNRHGTFPFESVKDAKSAIRWIRENADRYRIDKEKIIASGNSAGGHLILCAALLEKYNESTDNLDISPVPNLMMINSGVYDLSIASGGIWAEIEDRDSIISISPIHNIKKLDAPILMIHGTNDSYVPCWTAEKFYKDMQDLSNKVELQIIDGAGHFFWFDPKFIGEGWKVEKDFLKSNGY